MASPKELIKLAAACRKAGIKSFTSPEFSFTLTDDLPQKPRKATARVIQEDNSSFESDTLSPEEMLFWSAAPGGAPFSGEKEDS
jgi:hypothetical protein